MGSSTPISIPYDELKRIANTFGTPFYIYDEEGIKTFAQELKKAFGWADFQEFFAVKALPIPRILKIFQDIGFGFDCSSHLELALMRHLGVSGERIMLTSNATSPSLMKEARDLGAIINLDDISHIGPLLSTTGVPNIVSFRFNPGETLDIGNAIIVSGVDSKFGCTEDQLIEAYKRMSSKGVKRFGIHTMPGSNMLDPEYFRQVASLLFRVVKKIENECDIHFEFADLGGGLGINYAPGESPLNIWEISHRIKAEYDKEFGSERRLKLCFESGRAMTGPFGYFVTKVLHVEQKYAAFVKVDGNEAQFPRPGRYSAYHKIVVLGKEDLPADQIYNVAGSLCEGIMLAKNRPLPVIEKGDLLVFCNAGAHCSPMQMSYNGTLPPNEYLYTPQGTILVKKAETVKDILSRFDIELGFI